MIFKSNKIEATHDSLGICEICWHIICVGFYECVYFVLWVSNCKRVPSYDLLGIIPASAEEIGRIYRIKYLKAEAFYI